MFFLFLTLISCSETPNVSICIYKETISSCPSSMDLYFYERNVSFLNLHSFQHKKVSIFVRGNIETALVLDSISNIDSIYIFGDKINSDLINLHFDSYLTTTFYLKDITVSLMSQRDAIQINGIIGFSLIGINAPNITLKAKRISIPLSKFLHIGKIECDVLSFDNNNSIYELEGNIDINCSQFVQFININIVKFGFNLNKMLVSKISTQAKQKFILRFIQPCSIEVINDNKNQLYFTNYYQYYKPFFTFSLFLKHCSVTFDDCEWYSSESMFTINAEKDVDFYLFSSLPAYFSIRDDCSIVFSRDKITIDGIECYSSTKFYSLNSQYTARINKLVVATSVVIDIDDLKNLIIDDLEINTSNDFFLGTDSKSQVELHRLKCSNFIDHFKIEVNNLNFNGLLWIELPNSANESSIIRANRLVGSGVLLISYPDNYQLENEKVAFELLFVENIDSYLAYLIDIPNTKLDIGSHYISSGLVYDLFVKRLRFTAKIAKSPKGQSFCFGNNSVCNEEKDIIISNKVELFDWYNYLPGDFSLLNFKILDNNLFSEDIIDFYHISEYETIDFKITGRTDSGVCTNNNFVFNGLIFYQFDSIYIDCLNTSLVHLRSRSNLQSINLRNTYIDSVLEKTFLSAPSITIDYPTLKNLNACKNGSINFEKFRSDSTVTLECDDRNIYFYEECICLDDINITAKIICLDPLFQSLKLIGRTNKSVKYSVNITNGFSDLHVLGDFPQDFTIPATINSDSNIYCSTDVFPLSILIDNNMNCNFSILNKNVKMPSLLLTEDCGLYFKVQNEATLTIKRLYLINTEGFIPSLKNLKVNIDEIYFQGDEFIGTTAADIKKYKVDQNSGAKIIFPSEHKIHDKITIEVPFSLYRLSQIQLNNGTYENLELNMYSISEDAMLKDYYRIKADPNSYLDPVDIACGNDIKCDTWKVNLKTKVSFWNEYYKFECRKSEEENCLVGVLDPVYIIRFQIMYKIVFISIGIVIVLFSFILLGRKLSHRFKLKRHEIFSFEIESILST